MCDIFYYKFGLVYMRTTQVIREVIKNYNKYEYVLYFTSYLLSRQHNRVIHNQLTVVHMINILKVANAPNMLFSHQIILVCLTRQQKQGLHRAQKYNTKSVYVQNRSKRYI